MTRDEVIETYMLNSKKVIAEMLYDTISRYESRLNEKCMIDEQACKRYFQSEKELCLRSKIDTCPM